MFSRSWASSEPASSWRPRAWPSWTTSLPTMRDTILANVGCLAVFQVAGSDARQLVWELGKERVSAKTTSPPWTCITATSGPPWARSGCPPFP